MPGDASALARVRATSASPGESIGITGSISVVRQLIPTGLLDEYRLYVYPVVLGRGKQLFADATRPERLRLVECTRFRSGIVLLSYRPA